MRILLSGACGRMGRAIAEICDPPSRIVAGVDQFICGAPFPIYASFADIKESADAIIDVSHPDVLAPLLDYAIARVLPLVIATTGANAAQEQRITDAARHIPVMRSPNFSIGINVLRELAVKAAAMLPDSDIEIVESHHRMKADSPSGTALDIANALTAADNRRHILNGRKPEDGRREPHQIGVHSIRGGSGTGDHSVYFMMDGETIELKHASHGREIFARGALRAAAWLMDKPPGLYGMADILSL